MCSFPMESSFRRFLKATAASAIVVMNNNLLYNHNTSLDSRKGEGGRRGGRYVSTIMVPVFAFQSWHQIEPKAYE